MSLLIFAYRHQDIIGRKNALNMKLMELKQKLMELQTYASSIADGSVSMNDLMNAPASMFGRMSIFMMYSHQAGMAGAQEKMPMMSQMSAPQMQQMAPQMQQQYQQAMFKSLYDQEKETFSKNEQRILNEQEKRGSMEVSKIETQLKMLDKDEEEVSKAEDKAAEKSAPKYVA